MPGIEQSQAVLAAERIVIVVSSLGVGGAERVASTMANAWARQGRRVCLVSTFLGATSSAFELHPSVEIVFLAERMGAGKQAQWLAPVLKAVALRRLIRALDAQVVISFLTNVNLLAIVAMIGMSTPLIISERTDPAADAELSPAIKAGRRWLYRFADRLVMQTEAAAVRLGARGVRLPSTVVIPNPLPRQLDESPARATHASSGTVVALGRLSPEKGYPKLLAAFALAISQNPGWTLQIWGDGPSHEVLAAQVADLGLEERVRLCGRSRDPWGTLVAAQVFALSSDYEGFPNAMLEAMALGLPCVAFDCPSGPGALADGGAAAVIVPAGDIEAMAYALGALMADPQRREGLGVRAARYVREQFSETGVMARWDALMAEVMFACRKRAVL